MSSSAPSRQSLPRTGPLSRRIVGAWHSAVLLSVLVGLAGCSSEPGPSRTSQPTVERNGAPTVDRPLDVTGIYGDPCSQLTRDERRTLAIVREGSSRSFLGDSECRWTSQGGDILALSVDRNRDLLADTYRARALPVFLPVIVAGYPAVREMTKIEDNNCVVTIGLGPEQALRADWTGLGTYKPGDPDPCERAETAAAMVIRKLPPQR
ncbi:DUF3558 domain-containing protein [Actinomycetospora sp. CA-084318]|uniref:DUF3558 domain-containing protein n=1 Tax=Actinomycetospora sp. CA-084318 TaxID=3239892 RepID=UPI003D99C0D0